MSSRKRFLYIKKKKIFTMFKSVVRMCLQQEIAKVLKQITIRLNEENRVINIRELNTFQANIVPEKSAGTLISKDELREFMAVFPDIVRDLTDVGRYSDIPEATRWFTKVLQHNVPNSKKIRGLAVVRTYKMLEDPEKLTPKNIRLANIMGWCIEMLQTLLVITDDIMDCSETRRGIPCWYKNVGLSAINDGVFIENSIYSILRYYFSSLPIYIPCLELFHDTVMKTAMGQVMDNLSAIHGKPNWSAFTMNRYNAMVKYKTAYYHHLPVALGMYLGNKCDPEMHRQAKIILLEIGRFIQIQNDFLDCFGDVSVTGKGGTDIQQGKCTWLVVLALQRATTTQKDILQCNYGQNNVDAVLAVKALYEELDLPNIYAIYKEENFKLIRTNINQISKGLPHELFIKVLNMYMNAATTT